MFKDPLPLLVIALLTFPLWLMTFALATLKFRGSVDTLQLQNYANIAQIRRNTDKS